MTRTALLACASLVLVAVGACKDEKTTAVAAKVGAKPIGHSECASCSMVVGEQPAPRGQVVHRDGTHVHFCSVDDMLQYLHAPSRHGAAVEIYTEVMAPDHDPGDMSVDERPWQSVESVHFVTGVKREGVMGPPLLTYKTKAAAEAAAAKHKGGVLSFEELRAKSKQQ